MDSLLNRLLDDELRLYEGDMDGPLLNCSKLLVVLLLLKSLLSGGDCYFTIIIVLPFLERTTRYPY